MNYWIFHNNDVWAKRKQARFLTSMSSVGLCGRGIMYLKVIVTNALVGIKLSCLIALIVHLAYIVIGKLKPESTISMTEKIQLDQMDFPAVFKICIKPGFNETTLSEVGYDSVFDYFTGRSKYDGQTFGWSGHTKDGQPFSNASDVQKRIHHDYQSVINNTLASIHHNESFEYYPIPTHTTECRHLL